MDPTAGISYSTNELDPRIPQEKPPRRKSKEGNEIQSDAEAKVDIFDKSWPTIQKMMKWSFWFMVCVTILHTIQYPHLVVHEYVAVAAIGTFAGYTLPWISGVIRHVTT